MPPAKVREDTRPDASTTRERQVAAAAHARKSKNGTSAPQNGSSLKELALVSTEAGNVIIPSQGTGMSWNEASNELLNSYRVAHNLSMPAAFTSPLNQALLTNPGIGRQSPTMARKKEKRRVAKEQLALAVRKNFNGAAVSEIDVVVELVYKVRNRDKAFPDEIDAWSGEEAVNYRVAATADVTIFYDSTHYSLTSSRSLGYDRPDM